MSKSLLMILAACAALTVTGCNAGSSGQPAAGEAKPTAAAPQSRTDIIKPKRRTTVQPAQVEPYERVEIIPKITGYLQSYDKDLDGKEIDTGGRVRSGQILAIISVPELHKELKLKKA